MSASGSSTVRWIRKVMHNPRINSSALRAEEWAIIRAETFEAVCAKTGGRCFYCGEVPPKAVNIDHFRPLSKGGTDDLSNLFPTCRTCNSSKGGRSLEEWRMSRRLKIAHECMGVPKFSKDAVEWLFERGVDILEGIPDVEFWFEANGFEMPNGCCGNNEPPAWVRQEALKRLEARRQEMISDHITREAERQGTTVEEIHRQIVDQETAA